MKLLEKFGYVRYEYPLSRLTTFKIGGKAKAVVWVNDESVLPKFIEYLTKIDCPYYILGRGSNVLAMDEGFCGVIIKPMFKKITYQKEKDNIILNVSAGVRNAELLRFCLKHGFSGLEFLAGIPGRIGGTIFSNAGAFGQCMGEKIRRIKIFSPKTDVTWLKWSEERFHYRKTNLPTQTIILQAELVLKLDAPEKIKQRIAFYFRQKRETQPLFVPSAGCVFKNPSEVSAGYLIEQAGLKGKRIGGAKISEKHANFIINVGGATANDVLTLMALIYSEIKRRNGIELEPEIRVIQ